MLYSIYLCAWHIQSINVLLPVNLQHQFSFKIHINKHVNSTVNGAAWFHVLEGGKRGVGGGGTPLLMALHRIRREPPPAPSKIQGVRLPSPPGGEGYQTLLATEAFVKLAQAFKHQGKTWACACSARKIWVVGQTSRGIQSLNLD